MNHYVIDSFVDFYLLEFLNIIRDFLFTFVTIELYFPDRPGISIRLKSL